MDRIDKVISSKTEYTRSEIKNLIRKHRIMLNDNVIDKCDIKIDSSVDEIKIDGNNIDIRDYVYLVLNKPKGYISATVDKSMETVLDLVPSEYRGRNLFPVGRLDRDTTGLMIITDDGVFSHNVLSPKKHVKKKYNVVIDIPISIDMVNGFRDGIELSDGKCKSSYLEITSTYSGIVTLTEGRYHQIKRMFGCYGAKVLELQRISMGEFKLPSDLKLGQCRELTDEEIKLIKE